MTMAATVPTTTPSDPEQSEPPELKLTADTVEEFMAMLRRILLASGLTAGKVAKMTKLPRSTAYRFVDRANTTLPARVEQVERFARACKLRDDQIARVVRTWHELNGSTAEDDVEQDPVAPVNEVSDRPPVEEPKADLAMWLPEEGRVERRIVERRRRDQDAEDELQMNQQLRELLDVMWSEQNLKRLKKNGGSTPPVLIYNNAPKTTSSLIAGRHAPVRSWAFRRQVLALLALVLQPMIVRIFGNPEQTVLLHAVFFGASAVALLLLPQLGRPSVVPSNTRLCIAGAVGITTAGLTWWATTWPLLALMSGFLMFMAVPMWLAVMNQDQIWKHLFDCGRGYYVVILAAWFGLLTGVFLATGHGSIVGAIFGAALTASGVLMEATAQIMTKKCPRCERDENDHQQPKPKPPLNLQA